MSTQTKIALDKEKHPERFCRAQRCLWRVVKFDHATQTYTARPDCPGGYCPRHKKPDDMDEALAAIRRAAAIARAEGVSFISALRRAGALC